MPTNQFDFDQAVLDLREERPSAVQLQRMGTRRTTHRPLKFALAASAAAAATFILWPRESVGSAWARVIKSMEGRPSHSVMRDKSGRKIGEVWRDGIRSATIYFDKQNHVSYESRFDGKKMIMYIHRSQRLPNAYDSAVVYEMQGKIDPYDFGDSKLSKSYPFDTAGENFYAGFLKSQIDSGAATIVESKSDTLNGAAVIRYRIENKRTPKNTTVVYADATSTSILRVEAHGGVNDFDYPDHIDSAIFAPKLALSKDALIFDRVRESAMIAKVMRKGIARQGPTILRYVALEPSGALWIFWSGQGPNGKMTRTAQLIGIKAEGPFGNSRYTTGGAKMLPKSVTPVYGVAYNPLVKIGSTVSLKVPTKSGYVRFDKVPVVRTTSPYSIPNYVR